MSQAPELSLADLRQNYSKGELKESSVNSNPIAQFQDWFAQARSAELPEPNAMTLATATGTGRPSARIVLLKEVSENGFVFFTNYLSRKGEELLENPHAALLFYWAELEREVRVEGTVSRLERARTEDYFKRRPKGSRLGAMISEQSRPVASRTILEMRLSELEEQYRNTEDIPVPETWGGYNLAPQTIEFWQGRPNRLHDRLLFRREHQTSWSLHRLAP